MDPQGGRLTWDRLQEREGHMVYKIEKTGCAAPIFDGWEETMIWSCLQGVMGHIYGDDKEKPASAMAILGDFCFLAGVPEAELASYKPEWCTQDFIIIVPQNRQWAEVIEKCYGEKARKVVRYAMKKESDVFRRDRLEDMVRKLPPEYTLHMIDEPVFRECRKEDWCRDLVLQFADYNAYRETGMGVVIMKDGVPVAGASSYTAYRGGIEIEIDTKKEYRRRGLATVCGAKLILACLDRGWYPSWDAQNLWSVGLAEKLGYHFSHEYEAYEIYGY